jgi:phospholipid/cholesterol/gamma-HCH transport system substrate-binding protein
METRAHFIIIGLFTLLGILGGLGFFLWLASVQVDRQYAQYGVLFENVTGLDQSADVLFNGVAVGSVMSIRIWEDDPSQAYVAVEIDANTPVAVDTVARLESQGVTGVAYIALSGGSPGAALLTPGPAGPPIIPSRQSSFQSLVSSAPDLIEDAAKIIAQLEELTGPENQDHVRNILQNVDSATEGLEQALADLLLILRVWVRPAKRRWQPQISPSPRLMGLSRKRMKRLMHLVQQLIRQTRLSVQ